MGTIMDAARKETGEQAVDELLARYVAEQESGGQPDPEAYVAELGNAQDKAAFREMLAELAETSAHIEGPVRSGVVLGGRFRVEDELGEGRGGMGKVFAAYDVKLERTVALKVLRDHTGGALDAEGRLLQEAIHQARPQHPNILGIHEIVQDSRATYLVMDLVQGVDLSTVIERVRDTLALTDVTPRRAELFTEAIGLPAPEGRPSLIGDGRWFDAVARIALEMARCLEAAHGAGVVHRDLKPRNIMLRGDGTPVVLDFGLAFACNDGRTEARGRLMGSAAYLAPEQIRKETLGDDPRSDVYQLGVMLYELLTLQRAFDGRDLSEVLHHITRGEFARPRKLDRGIPFELEAICLRAMELDPERRYQTASELSADLLRFADGSELPHAARGGLLASSLRATRYALRRKWVALASAGVALVLGAGIAAWFAPTGDERVDFFVYDRTTGEYDTSPTRVSQGDVVGVMIECDAPRFIYALSVYGEKDPPTWIAPMPSLLVGPETDEGGSNVELPDDRPIWELRVEAGKHVVNCTEITDVAEDIPFEGLWVFVSEEPAADIEAWMEELEYMNAETDYAGVPYEKARRAYDLLAEVTRQRRAQSDPLLDRGHRPSQKNAEELGRQFEAAAMLGETEWPHEHPRRYDRVLEVDL